MKIIFIIIILLFSQTESYAQSKEKNDCLDTTKYIIKNNIPHPELKIKINGDWKSFDLIEGTVDMFNYECKEIKFNGKDSEGLVIRWSNAVYGTGGGSIIEGIQIWNLDSAKKLLDEITYCSDENFGRSGNSYFIFCQKKIEIRGNNIRIYKERCKTEWSTKNYKVPNPICDRHLSTIKPGNYNLVNGQLERK